MTESIYQSNIYAIIPDYEWNDLSEKKKALLKFEIKVSLYDDFYVKLEDMIEVFP